MQTVPHSVEVFQRALDYAAKGWAVLPLRPNGKEPLVEGGVHAATTDPATIREWWARHPNANIGIALGRASGIVVLDVDDRDALRDLIEQHGPLPDTPTVVTARGAHYYFQCPPGGLRTRRIAPGVELRGDGSYVVVPPSVHPTGKRYEWELAPGEVNVAPLPAWLLATATGSRPASAQPSELPPIIPEGTRNDTLFGLAREFRRSGIAEERILEFLRFVNATRCRPPLDDHEVVKLFRSACRYHATPAEAGGRPNDSQTTRLTQLGEQAELWHTPEGEAWATVLVGDHREYWPLRSRTFREWLARQHFLQYGHAPHSQAIHDALRVLEAEAKFTGPEYVVFTRVAEHAGAIYLDLADEQWRAVEITASGWRVVPTPPVRFRRTRGMHPLPAPEAGGMLDTLWRYVNVAEDDRILVAGWLVMLLAPRGPYPVLVLNGEQGSGKSTTARVLRRILDPNEADLRAEPRELRDLVIAAHNSWVVALDNVSRLPQWLSDALCRLSTGGGFATRELYTDRDEVIFSVQRPCVITALGDVVSAPDLLDRALLITCPTLVDTARLPEDVLWSEFAKEQPRLLGALCDLASRALANREAAALEEYPRMADFARWALAALGQNSGFLERYRGNRRTAAATALEASPLGEVLLQFMAQQDRWEGTAKELLRVLTTIAGEDTHWARSSGWPKTPRGLAGELRKLAPALRTQGLEVRFVRRHGGTRMIVLEKWGMRPSPPSPSSPSSQNRDGDAVFSGDGWVTVHDGEEHNRHRNRHRDFWLEDAKKHQHGDGGDGGDGSFPHFSNAQCPVCRQPYEVRPSERAGWVQIRCQCTRGWDWCRADDPALRRSS